MAQPNRWSQFTAPELMEIMLALEERWTEIEKRINGGAYANDPASRADLNRRYLIALILHQEVMAILQKEPIT